MVLKPITLLFTFVLALPLVTVVFVQDAPGQNQAAKKGSWEGNVVRSNPDKSTFTVRQVGTNVEETIHYDGATRWVSQEHGSKKVNTIDATQVKDNDRVIVRGIWDKGVLYATLISKRLSYSD